MNFLENNDFILWRLTRDSDMEAFWNAFIAANPALKDDIERDIEKFARLRIKPVKHHNINSNVLLQRVKATIRRRYSIRHIIYKYAAAACIALTAGAGVYIYKSAQEARTAPPDIHAIVGENLSSQNIRLISNRNIQQFDRDVTVHLDRKGVTTVRKAGADSVTAIVETKHADTQTLLVPYGKRSQLELSDGTKVWLNSGSSIIFPSVFTDATREITLSGEIYIEVAPDRNKPFIVHTDNFDVRVYGTKFDISAYRNDQVQSVALAEGKVSIKNTHREEIFLQPNEMLSIKGESSEKSAVDINKHISWKNGYIMFDATPMTEVLLQLERYYNLSFRIGDEVNLQSRRCTGKIVLSDNLDEVMETVALLSSATFSKKDDTIYITY